MNKRLLKKALLEKTKCSIQHDGWCCNTCFFAIDGRLTEQDWQSLLLFRGDYRRKDLNNLTNDIEKSLVKIYNLVKK